MKLKKKYVPYSSLLPQNSLRDVGESVLILCLFVSLLCYYFSFFFSSLTDPELDNNVTEIIKNHCCIAENVIKEHLLNRGISVQRKRLRASIHRFKDLQYEKPVLPPKRTKPGSSVSRQTAIPRKESNKGILVKSEVIEDIS